MPIYSLFSGRYAGSYLPGSTFAETDRSTFISRTVVVAPLQFGAVAMQGPVLTTTYDGVTEDVGSRTVQPFVVGGMFVGIAAIREEGGQMWAVGQDAALIIFGPVLVLNPSGDATAGAPVYFDSVGNITANPTGSIAIPKAIFDTRTDLKSRLVKIRLG